MYMALFAVPRAFVRAIMWIVMGVVGALFAATEKAYAAVTYGWNGTRLEIEGDANDNTIYISSNGLAENSVSIFADDSVYDTGSAASVVSAIEVAGNGGDDYINLGSSVTGGMGFINMTGATLKGNAGNDTILGSGFANDIDGGGGADLLKGGGVGDVIQGRDGNDTLVGGYGRDLLFGDAGDDVLYHGTMLMEDNPDGAEDHLEGNDDNDTFYASTDPPPNGDGDDVFP